MPMSPAEFERLLRVVAEKLTSNVQLLERCQREFSAKALRFSGQAALMESFKALFINTVQRVNTDVRPKVLKKLSEHYGLFVPRLIVCFHGVNGAEISAMQGYPLQGFTVLRNIFDHLLMTGAALQKVTDFYSIEGVVPGKTLDMKAMRRLRKNTEFAAIKAMYGCESGLSDVAQEQMGKLNDLYDYEVHGARFSAAVGAEEWFSQKAGLAIVPIFDEMAFGLFVNRYNEVGWMLHRLLPLLQPPGILLCDEWKADWSVVDNGFREVIAAMSADLKKPIGNAFVEFVETKFPFKPESTFPL